MSDATVPGLVFCVMVLVLLAAVAVLCWTAPPAGDETPIDGHERAATREDAQP